MQKTTEKIRLPHPQALIDKLSERDETLEAYSRNPRMERALATTAFKLVDGVNPNEKNRSTIQGLQLVATLPDFIQAQEELKDRSNLNRQSEIEFVAATTRFNEVLRDVMNHNPNMTMRDLSAYIVTTANSMGNDSLPPNLGEGIRRRIEGMRHELAFEAALYRIDGVDDVRTATPEEDRHGVDIVVAYRGRQYKIDIKASRDGAQRKAAKFNGRSANNVPMWSGLVREHFGDQLRMTDERLIQEHAEYIQGELNHLQTVGKDKYIAELALS